MKVRIKFNKLGAVKYTGHLDIMRYFQKLFRRAGIDIAYSKGFHPHPILSFASPLGVGMESEAEYLDLEVNATLPAGEAIGACNAASVPGIQILAYTILPDDAKNAMSIVSAADYRYEWKDHVPDAAALEDLREKLSSWLARPEIYVLKKSKKSEQEINIRPGIYKMVLTGNAFFMQLSAGSVLNIKPELALTAFFESCAMSFDPCDFRRVRTEVYREGEDGLQPLDAV